MLSLLLSLLVAISEANSVSVPQTKHHVYVFQTMAKDHKVKTIMQEAEHQKQLPIAELKMQFHQEKCFLKHAFAGRRREQQ